jgi:hypothetical protein
MRSVAMRKARLAGVAAIAFGLISWHPNAQAQSCPHTVVFTVPGITWHDIRRVRPPEILAVARAGAVGSMSVRTNTPRTSYASGFATLGAGSRVDGGTSSGGPADVTDTSQERRLTPVTAAGLDEIRRLLEEAGYSTVKPGALAEAMRPLPVIAIGNSDAGRDPPVPEGLARWSLLAAMDTDGHVDLSATGSEFLRDAPDVPHGVRTDLALAGSAIEDALAIPCSTLFVDPGDLTRVDHLASATGTHPSPPFEKALGAADELLGDIRNELDSDDLLIVVSPTAPGWDQDVHFGVVIAQGRDFPAGTLLESPSTRRPGIVSLPDVAPTILSHLGIDRPSSMFGRAMFARETQGDRIAGAAALDSESVFIDEMRVPVSTGFVIAQVLFYALVMILLLTGESRPGLSRWVQVGAFIPVAFPVATYLAGLVPQASLGPWGFIALLLAVDIAIVAVAFLIAKNPLDRLLLIAGFTFVVLVSDLLIGAPLQLNTVFSYSPLVAGRFAGIGNIAYSVLAAATVIVGAIIVHRGRGSARALIAAAAVFVIAVIADGAPTFGADVGGILALVPGLAITWFLLARKQVRPRDVAVMAIGLVAALALFLAVDLALPERFQTHLARLYEAVRAEGPDPLIDVVGRKIETNLRVFTSTIWTYLVPPALVLIAWLLMRPRNGLRRLAESYPRLRAGLLGGLLLAILGFAVNDSGIVVPAMMLTFLVPLALFVHLAPDPSA